MGAIRNVSGQTLFVPGAGIVDDQQVVEVPDDVVYAFTASANFEPVGAESKALHDEAAAEEAERVEAERAERGLAPAGEITPPAKPSGNASREEWADYVVGTGLATEDEVVGLGRDQLRDQFGG